MTFIATPFALLAPTLIEKLGRRPLFLTMSFLCTTEWAFLGFSQWMSETQIGPPVGLFGIALGNVSFMLGILTMTPIILNELCPFAAKAKVTEVLFWNPWIAKCLCILLNWPLIDDSQNWVIIIGLFI